MAKSEFRDKEVPVEVLLAYTYLVLGLSSAKTIHGWIGLGGISVAQHNVFNYDAWKALDDHYENLIESTSLNTRQYCRTIVQEFINHA